MLVQPLHSQAMVHLYYKLLVLFMTAAASCVTWLAPSIMTHTDGVALSVPRPLLVNPAVYYALKTS
jgi:hypothetical protein